MTHQIQHFVLEDIRSSSSCSQCSLINVTASLLLISLSQSLLCRESKFLKNGYVNVCIIETSAAFGQYETCTLRVILVGLAFVNECRASFRPNHISATESELNQTEAISELKPFPAFGLRPSLRSGPGGDRSQDNGPWLLRTLSCRTIIITSVSLIKIK